MVMNLYKDKFVLITILILLILVFNLTSSQANEDKKNILIIHSYYPEFGWTANIDRGIRSILGANSENINLHTEYLDTKRIIDKEHINNLYRLFKHKFKDAKFDLIISSDDDALKFLLEYRDDLFSNTSVVFCGISDLDKYSFESKENFSGIEEKLDMKSTIKVALNLHPNIDKVVAITDGTTTGLTNLQMLKVAMNDIPEPISLITYKLSYLTEVKEIARKLDKNSIIVWLASIKYDSGNLISLTEATKLISKYTNRPIYSFWDVFPGNGVLGGKISSGYQQGRIVSQIALSILKGEEPVIEESPNKFMFDYHELKRFNIPFDKLPKESIIVNRPRSFYNENRGKVLATLAFIIFLTIIICLLLINILRRQVAEEELKESRNKYRTLFQATGTASCILEKDTTFSLVNDKMEEVLGYSKEEIEGKMKLLELIMDHESLSKILNYHCQRKSDEDNISERYELDIIDNFGEKKTVIIQAKLIPDSEKSIVSLIDITERKKAEEKIKYISYHDSLTGLYNRKFYEEELKRLDVERKLPLSIIVGDANGLKLTNDVFGHEAGDKLLKEIASILRNASRKEDIIARWGGDEFGIILTETSEEVAQNIIKRIKEGCESSDFDPIIPQIALGCATKIRNKEDIKEVYKRAENRMYEDKAENKSSSNSALLKSLTEKLENNSYETVGHTSRMISMSRKMGYRLDLSERDIDKLVKLAKYHDIGKLPIRKEVLNKDKFLTEKEWEEFKKHPEHGYNIAKSFQDLRSIANDILYHHENWDGTGYPEELAGEDIPFLSRVVHIVDAYDALLNRPYNSIDNSKGYQGPMSKIKAIQVIKDKSGKFFDPELVDVFLKLIEDEKDNS
ncbi:hypothetical protein U472_07910 [Orenia metallireducens]|uniref:PAS domain S-box-containing protein/diguanylate cyclase (GGDEF) domain-containing protein n=1 Tax=Orenia metallireducens TaxID=1413210 RepID=A0A1C0AAT1_9FIRM|nr:diguanylate cyclase [Orenia metallireducens]OCL27373.1 hypothetical protein U472_07910 [Orenia metallireducens]